MAALVERVLSGQQLDPTTGPLVVFSSLVVFGRLGRWDNSARQAVAWLTVVETCESVPRSFLKRIVFCSRRTPRKARSTDQESRLSRA